jgi:hypothetical protein
VADDLNRWEEMYKAVVQDEQQDGNSQGLRTRGAHRKQEKVEEKT